MSNPSPVSESRIRELIHLCAAGAELDDDAKVDIGCALKGAIAHNAELRRALEDHLARFIGLDKALDDAARAALSAGRSGE